MLHQGLKYARIIFNGASRLKIKRLYRWLKEAAF
jgi:hypothetical protein